jgi:hypothetical protein
MSKQAGPALSGHLCGSNPRTVPHDASSDETRISAAHGKRGRKCYSYQGHWELRRLVGPQKIRQHLCVPH